MEKYLQDCLFPICGSPFTSRFAPFYPSHIPHTLVQGNNAVSLHLLSQHCSCESTSSYSKALQPHPQATWSCSNIQHTHSWKLSLVFKGNLTQCSSNCENQDFPPAHHQTVSSGLSQWEILVVHS